MRCVQLACIWLGGLVAGDIGEAMVVAREVSADAVALEERLEAPQEHVVRAYVASSSTIEPSHFGGLVLGCIDSYDREKRRIFKHIFVGISATI